MTTEIRAVATGVSFGALWGATVFTGVKVADYIDAKQQRQTRNALLYDAIAQQKLPELAAWIQLYKNVEERNGDGWTPLQEAIRQNWGPAVQLLVAKGANVNAVREVPNARPFTRLLIAADKTAMLQRESTLDVAMKTKNPESIRSVVEGGAAINAKNFSELKALMPMVIRHSSLETVSYFLNLLHTKADKEVMNQYLPLALEHKRYDVAACLMQKFSFDKEQAVQLFSQIKEQETDLHYAQTQPGFFPQSRL